MNKTSRHAMQGTIVLAAILFLLPFQAAHASASITIKGPVYLTPDLKFPAGGAFSFRPGIVSVAQGGKVIFSNNDYDDHTVTSYTNKVNVNFEGANVNVPIPDGHFDSLHTVGPIFSGQTFTVDTTNLAPGDYNYFCQFHPWMQATIRVTSGGSTSASVNILHHLGNTDQFFSGSANWGFFARNTQVSQGTIVAVTNSAPILHTFSSYTITIPVTQAYHTITIPISNGVFNQTIAPGQTYNLDTGRLAKGTYTFACLFHPWMLGTLTVN